VINFSSAYLTSFFFFFFFCNNDRSVCLSVCQLEEDKEEEKKEEGGGRRMTWPVDWRGGKENGHFTFSDHSQKETASNWKADETDGKKKAAPRRPTIVMLSKYIKRLIDINQSMTMPETTTTSALTCVHGCVINK
jgi:hypothetical protein